MKMVEIHGRKESILARHELVVLVAISRGGPYLLPAEIGSYTERHGVSAYLARQAIPHLYRQGLAHRDLDMLKCRNERVAYRITDAGRAAIDRTERYHASMVAICQESK